MTTALFITLLTVFATVTGLVTEAVKKICKGQDKPYASNLIATIVACVVGIGGTAAYYVLFHIPFSAANIVCMVLMGLATAVGSMTSYDKVVQAIDQIRKTHNG